MLSHVHIYLSKEQNIEVNFKKKVWEVFYSEPKYWIESPNVNMQLGIWNIERIKCQQRPKESCKSWTSFFINQEGGFSWEDWSLRLLGHK